MIPAVNKKSLITEIFGDQSAIRKRSVDIQEQKTKAAQS